MTSHRTTSYLCRQLPLHPAWAAEAFDHWSDRVLVRRADRAVAGQLRLRLGALDPGIPDRGEGWPFRRVQGELRSPDGWRVGQVEIEVGSWSQTRSEVGLRLVGRRWPPPDSYFAVGHAALDQVTAELEEAAGRLGIGTSAQSTAFRYPMEFRSPGITRDPVRSPLRPVAIVAL